MVWPASKQQQRCEAARCIGACGSCVAQRCVADAHDLSPLCAGAARLQNALARALLEQDELRETLVSRLGFCVKSVRMSPDNLKAFILWDSYTGAVGTLEGEVAIGPWKHIDFRLGW